MEIEMQKNRVLWGSTKENINRSAGLREAFTKEVVFKVWYTLFRLIL